eukprot:6198051-Pleurochrysis_carterae.AAC.2
MSTCMRVRACEACAACRVPRAPTPFIPRVAVLPPAARAESAPHAQTPRPWPRALRTTKSRLRQKLVRGDRE